MKLALWSIALGAALLLVCAALAAPYLYSEYEFDLYGSSPTAQPAPVVPVNGNWFDSYYLVQRIDERTFAIGEPRYYQGNYSYLILGRDRAVLFDGGPGFKDIVPVVRSLTTLPVTVIPSHLHFDHVGAVGKFERTALVESLRSRALDGVVTLSRYEFLGFADRLEPPSIRVDEWLSPGAWLELGQRRLKVVSTPGHTPTSIALYDPSARQLFAGDFIYPSMLYAFLPGASRADYLQSVQQIRALIDPGTTIWTAHMAGPPSPVQAPRLGASDLLLLEQTLVSIDHGTAVGSGFFPRSYAIRGDMRFATGWPWNNR